MAILLIALIIIIFLNALILSFNYMRRVMELRTASLGLQEQASVVRDMEFEEVESLPGTFSSGIMASLNNASGTILKSDYAGDSEIKMITFRITWTSFDNRAMSKTLVTNVTDHGINKK